MTITLQEGRFYKTRDGKKHGPIRKVDVSPCLVSECVYVVAGDEDSAYNAWRSDGTWECNRLEHPHDLVEEWADEPAQPFEVGDLVKLNSNTPAYGARYTSDLLRVDDIMQNGSVLLRNLEGSAHYDQIVAVSDIALHEACPAQEYVEGRDALPEPTGPTIGQATIDHMKALEDARLDAIAATTPVDIKAEIADEAKRIVSGARRSAYGKPEQNFERIARYWDAYFKNTGRDITITAADVSPLMRLVKEARLAETPDHRDSFVDLVGYALTGAEVNKVGLTSSV